MQDFLVEMDHMDLRYTCSIIQPSLMLLRLLKTLKTLIYFQGLHGERGLPGLIGRRGPKVSTNIMYCNLTNYKPCATCRRKPSFCKNEINK